MLFMRPVVSLWTSVRILRSAQTVQSGPRVLSAWDQRLEAYPSNGALMTFFIILSLVLVEVTQRPLPFHSQNDGSIRTEENLDTKLER